MPAQAGFTIDNFTDKIDRSEYGVLARHGWEWDFDCYGLSYYNKALASGSDKKVFDPVINSVIAYGEAVTAEVMAGFIFYARNNLGLNVPPDKQNADDLVILEQLRELNNLRPLSEVINWFPWLMKSFPQDKKDLVLNALQRALKNALNCRLAKEWPDDGGVLATMHMLNDLFFGNIFQKASVYIRGAWTKLKEVFSPDQEPLIKGAQTDFAGLSKAYRHVVYGHTHISQENCFFGDLNGAYQLYVNTGTFLPIIEGTTNASGASTKTYSTSFAMTMVFFYKGDEDTSGRAPGNIDPTVEFWDGRRRKKYKVEIEK
jgi:hypothetical protein